MFSSYKFSSKSIFIRKTTKKLLTSSMNILDLECASFIKYKCSKYFTFALYYNLIRNIKFYNDIKTIKEIIIFFSVSMLKMGPQEVGNILMDQAQGLSYNHKTCRSGESPFSTKTIQISICPQNPLLGILP